MNRRTARLQIVSAAIMALQLAGSSACMAQPPGQDPGIAQALREDARLAAFFEEVFQRDLVKRTPPRKVNY